MSSLHKLTAHIPTSPSLALDTASRSERPSACRDAFVVDSIASSCHISFRSIASNCSIFLLSPPRPLPSLLLLLGQLGMTFAFWSLPSDHAMTKQANPTSIEVVGTHCGPSLERSISSLFKQNTQSIRRRRYHRSVACVTDKPHVIRMARKTPTKYARVQRQHQRCNYSCTIIISIIAMLVVAFCLRLSSLLEHPGSTVRHHASEYSWCSNSSTVARDRCLLLTSPVFLCNAKT